MQAGVDHRLQGRDPENIAQSHSGGERAEGMRDHSPAECAARVAPAGQPPLWALEGVFAAVSLCSHRRREGPGPYEGLLQRPGWE